jgi:cell fate (sporulation/competence/biofilm development) regulator YmcA (YheA/YmcA/DUF963 family)
MEAGAEWHRGRIMDLLGSHLRHLEGRLEKNPKDQTLQQLAAQIVWLRAQIKALPLVE